MPVRRYAYLIYRTGRIITISMEDEKTPSEIEHREGTNRPVRFVYAGTQHGIAAYAEARELQGGG